MAGGRGEWGGEFWERWTWNGPCVGLRAFDDACFAQKFTLPRDIDENFHKMTHFYFRLMFALRHKNGMYQLSSHLKIDMWIQTTHVSDYSLSPQVNVLLVLLLNQIL
jgi:hypothetical protein